MAGRGAKQSEIWSSAEDEGEYSVYVGYFKVQSKVLKVILRSFKTETWPNRNDPDYKLVQ